LAATRSLTALFLQKLLFVFFLLSGFCATASAQMRDGKQLVQADLLANVDAVVPGKPFTVGLRLRMQPGWHTYWKYSGDSGMPTRLDWQLPPGFKAGEIQWPIPEKTIEPGDLWTYAYHDEVLLMVEITPPVQIAEKQVTLKAKASWLVCEKICVPGNANVSVTLPVQKQNAVANADLFANYRAQFPKEISAGPASQIVWSREGSDLLLDPSRAVLSNATDFFPLPPAAVVVGHPAAEAVPGQNARIRVPLLSEDSAIKGMNGILVTAAGEHWQINSGPAPDKTQLTNAVSKSPEHGLFGFLLFGFLGGLILNVMPCVLPVIALKIFGFIKQAGESRQKILRLGLAFVAGIFAWFLALAALIVAFKAAGHELNWAFQFQHPGFLIAMIVIIFAFALNLLGVFEIVLPGRAQTQMVDLAGREGYGGAFLHGVFATLMATPCTAPFLGPALGFALAQTAPIVFAMFGSIALGMSAPYFILAARPAWLGFMPKPGMWMVRVKQAMGVLLLGTVAWLGWVLWQQQHNVAQPFAPQLAHALKQNRIVFVDFTADWCVNCKVNERLVLNTDEVQRAFREHNVIFLKADWTNGDADITKLLKGFNRAGVPAYVVYPPGGEPVVLPEILKTQTVLEALAQAAH
jgi:DsbC/DsbD-like thiol-disulfide interchange protein/cytochrome c biogenesis protein CcdA